MMIHLSAADLAVIGIFCAAVLVAGFSVRKRDREGALGFLLAGRPLTLPLFVMTLVATWYGGILGVGEFSYLYGVSNWVTQGLPYYVFAALFAWFLAPRIRASNLLTIPDKLEASYDRKTALLGAFLIAQMLAVVSHVPGGAGSHALVAQFTGVGHQIFGVDHMSDRRIVQLA